MASDAAGGEPPAVKPRDEQEVITVDLPAPEGWMKKYIPKKSGTPKRNEIVFISPSGEEIKNKKQLDQYLRSHPGGPPSTEFDWGTGDTPRRSARISEKAKATGTLESEPPKKRERKSSSKKGAKKETVDEEGAAAEDQGAGAAEAKGITDVEMKQIEVGIDESKGKAPADEAKEEAPETIKQDLANKTKDNVEEEAKEEAQETIEQDLANKTKDNVEEEAKEEAPETIEQDLANKTKDNVEEEGEEAAKQNADTGKNIKDESVVNGNEEKTENEVLGNEYDVLPPASEGKEEETPADSEIKDGDIACEDGRQKDNKEEAPKSIPSLNCDDGQCQPEPAAVNC